MSHQIVFLEKCFLTLQVGLQFGGEGIGVGQGCKCMDVIVNLGVFGKKPLVVGYRAKCFLRIFTCWGPWSGS